MPGTLTVKQASLAAVTDLGRTRGPEVGLPVNGALDQYSAQAANLLVGNSRDAPLIEVLSSDFAFWADADMLISVTGADLKLTVDGEMFPQWEPVSVHAHQVVQLTGMTSGVRCYLAVHGSMQVPLLLGSCAPDPVIGFSGTIVPGQSLQLRCAEHAPVSPYWGQSLFKLGVPIPHIGEEVSIGVIDGPEVEEFRGTAHRLFADTFCVGDQSNHVGLRLRGDRIPVRSVEGEKISRAVPIGAVEIPAGDELLILHRGRGVTAGYPVLGVVTSPSLDVLGQVGPGQIVRFRHRTLQQAAEDAEAWRSVLRTVQQKVQMAFEALGFTGSPYRTK